MTREEAIQIYENWVAGRSGMGASGYIDFLVRLGMLKLDEPKREPVKKNGYQVYYGNPMRRVGERGLEDPTKERAPDELGIMVANALCAAGLAILKK